MPYFMVLTHLTSRKIDGDQEKTTCTSIGSGWKEHAQINGLMPEEQLRIMDFSHQHPPTSKSDHNPDHNYGFFQPRFNLAKTMYILDRSCPRKAHHLFPISSTALSSSVRSVHFIWVRQGSNSRSHVSIRRWTSWPCSNCDANCSFSCYNYR